MGGWFYVFFRLSLASESMSSQRYDATGLNSDVIPAMRCCRPQQLCHPSDGRVGKGMGSIAVEAVTIWFFLLCSAS